jgi:hypothetical protein
LSIAHDVKAPQGVYNQGAVDKVGQAITGLLVAKERIRNVKHRPQLCSLCTYAVEHHRFWHPFELTRRKKERKKEMFKHTRNYVRYAFSLLSAVGFALTNN